MTITLHHTIVPAHDKVASARFFAHIFGLRYEEPVSHFAPVRVNDTLTLDFDNRDPFERQPGAYRAPRTSL
jgi:catechol 2,3-dioxygenase-like lactoylglutathione lyase family enzyme